MAIWEVVCTDVLAWCKNYTGEPFHAILCDPSYALSKKKKIDPDAPVDAEIKTVRDLIAAYHSIQQWGDTGFMSKAWDTDVAFDPRTWAALAEHLLPGGFVTAFASSRGWHRMACAMEDSGLIIQPSIFIWLNSQAFPKATRIDVAIDKAAGKLGARKVRGKKVDISSGKPMSMKQARAGADKNLHEGWDRPWRHDDVAVERRTLDFEPATDLARAWEGHRYGGQVLKDAATPIIVAQKPWEGKRLDCIVKTGAGTLWIEGARIAPSGDGVLLGGDNAQEWCQCDCE